MDCFKFQILVIFKHMEIGFISEGQNTIFVSLDISLCQILVKFQIWVIREIKSVAKIPMKKFIVSFLIQKPGYLFKFQNIKVLTFAISVNKETSIVLVMNWLSESCIFQGFIVWEVNIPFCFKIQNALQLL